MAIYSRRGGSNEKECSEWWKSQGQKCRYEDKHYRFDFACNYTGHKDGG